MRATGSIKIFRAEGKGLDSEIVAEATRGPRNLLSAVRELRSLITERRTSWGNGMWRYWIEIDGAEVLCPFDITTLAEARAALQAERA